MRKRPSFSMMAERREVSSEEIANLKVNELKEELASHGLSTKGNKGELKERLSEFLGAQNKKETELDVLDDEIEQEMIGGLSNDKVPGSESSQDLSGLESSILASPTPAPKAANIENTTEAKPNQPQTAEEKRLNRAKRFGCITNTDDKRKQRSERFGIDTKTDFKIGGKPLMATELNKIKKRADRFGVVSPVMDKLSTEEKSLKRKERFGSAQVSNVVDAKKQSRAARFGL